MQVSLIVAMDRNRVIGRNDALPWHLPADLKKFKKITMGKPIIMGRKTHETIGRALSGRENVILTHDKNYQAESCVVLNSIEEVFEHCRDVDEIMVIGGAQIYKHTLTQATCLYLTEVHAAVEGDTFFPEFEYGKWKEVSRQAFKADEKNRYDYSFVVLKKV